MQKWMSHTMIEEKRKEEFNTLFYVKCHVNRCKEKNLHWERQGERERDHHFDLIRGHWHWGSYVDGGPCCWKAIVVGQCEYGHAALSKAVRLHPVTHESATVRRK